MQFDQVFYRQVNVAGSPFPALGSDAVPTTAPPPSNASGTMFLSFRSQNNSGMGITGLLVGYTANVAGANPATANVYVYNHNVGQWMIAATNVSLAANSLTRVTIPAPLAAKDASPKAVEVALYIPTFATANGTYTFAMSPGL